MPSSWNQVGSQVYSTYQGWTLLPTGICAFRSCRWAPGAPHTCSPCSLPPRLPFPWPGPAGRRLLIPSRLLEGNLESPGIRTRDRGWERKGGEQDRERTQIPNPVLVLILTMILERPLGFSIHFHNLAQGITKAPHFKKTYLLLPTEIFKNRNRTIKSFYNVMPMFVSQQQYLTSPWYSSIASSPQSAMVCLIR